MMHERNPLNNGVRFRNILEVRTVKYSIWKNSLQEHPKTLMLRYEYFMQSPKFFLDLIAEFQDLKELEKVSLPVGYKGIVSWKRRVALFLSFGTIGKFTKRTKLPLKLEDIDYISNNLDLLNESQWGYDIKHIANEERTFSECFLR